MKSSGQGTGGSFGGTKELQYRVVRLKTGETLLCQLAGNFEDFAFSPTVLLVNPIVINVTQSQTLNGLVQAENFILKPLLSLSCSEELPLSADVIMTMGDMKEVVRHQYDEYISKLKLRLSVEYEEEKVIQLLLEGNEGRPVSIIDIDERAAYITDSTSLNE